MASRDITFIADDNNADLIPCLSTDLLVSLGIKISIIRQQGTFGRKTCAGQQRMHTTSGSFG